MDQLHIMLIMVIAGIIGCGLLWMMMVMVYKKLYPHECRIETVRDGQRHIKNTRFRLTLDKEKNPILKCSPGNKGLKMPRPHENYFGVIGKKSLSCHIIVPANNQAYCIKPSFDEFGKIIQYHIDDRDVMAAAKQDLRAGVHKYMYKSNLSNMISFLAVMALIIISLLNGFWITKMNKQSIEASNSQSALVHNATLELASAMRSFNDYRAQLNGTFVNPINVGGPQ